MSRASRPSVLRGVILHTQPRPLARPKRIGAGMKDTEPARDALPALPQCGVEAGVSILRIPPVDRGYDAGFARGQKDGHAEGLQRGLEEAQGKLDQAIRSAVGALEQKSRRQQDEQSAEHKARIERLDALLAELSRAQAGQADRLETEAVSLAYAAVCKIVGDVPGQGEAIAATVGASIGQLRSASLLRIRLHERDLEALRASEAGLALLARHRSVQWVADATLVSGGCMLDTDQGTLDARLETQLARLRDAWTQAKASTPSPRADRSAEWTA